jgi:anhydro-N-acetylmuramic acid kinase
MSNLYIGILSGTSIDGIDVAAVSFDNKLPQITATKHNPLPAYKDQILQIIHNSKCTLHELGELDVWIGELFADAILDFIEQKNIDKKDIVAIGSHGQTIWHAPRANKPFTMQIGDPNVIAVKTGITTIADFRRADIAAGGQGAPLIPAFHHAIFADPHEARCILNIGGVSNLSILEHGKHTGFDTGVGNYLMDFWTQQHFNLPYDIDGKLAASGTVNQTLLACLLDDPYFKAPPPKSTGREDFNPAWLAKKISACGQHNTAPIDVLATLLELTANSITDAIRSYASPNTKVYAFGGGANNLSLCAKLSNNLEQIIQSTSALGVPGDWMEAALFAWLAKQRLNKTPIDLRAITGSRHPVLLGAIYE